MKPLRTFAFATILLLAASLPASAGSGASVAMGGLSAAYPGSGSFDVNPALTGIDSVFSLSFDLAELVFKSNTAYRPEYLTDTFFDEDDKDAILASIPQTGLGGMGGVSTAAKITYREFGMSASVRTYGHGNLAKDVIEVVLKGNELNTPYTVDGTRAVALAYGDFGGAMSMLLPFEELASNLNADEIRVGAGIRMIRGVGYAQFEVDESSFQAVWDDDEASITGEGTASGWFSLDGSGIALDLGVLVRFGESTYVGASYTGLGSITWSDVTEAELQFEFDTSEGRMEFEEVMTDEPGVTRRVPVPRHLNLGVYHEVNEWARVDAGYSLVSLPGGYSDSSLKCGVEVTPIRFLPLYAGLRYSPTRASTSLSLGTGLRFTNFRFDVGVSNLTLLSSGGKDFAVGMSTGIRF